jgi:hypothetical protein
LEISIDGSGAGGATLNVADTSRSGVPVNVIVPGPDEGVVFHGPIAEVLGLNSFTLDLSSLGIPDLVPVSVPADARVESDPTNVVLFAFAPPDGQTGAVVDWSGKMTPLQPPTDLHWLSSGPWRIVVVGRASDGALFQFAFDVDVQGD